MKVAVGPGEVHGVSKLADHFRRIAERGGKLEEVDKMTTTTGTHIHTYILHACMYTKYLSASYMHHSLKYTYIQYIYSTYIHTYTSQDIYAFLRLTIYIHYDSNNHYSCNRGAGAIHQEPIRTKSRAKMMRNSYIHVHMYIHTALHMTYHNTPTL
jgi:hypothetical protein